MANLLNTRLPDHTLLFRPKCRTQLWEHKQNNYQGIGLQPKKNLNPAQLYI